MHPVFCSSSTVTVSSLLASKRLLVKGSWGQSYRGKKEDFGDLGPGAEMLFNELFTVQFNV